MRAGWKAVGAAALAGVLMATGCSGGGGGDDAGKKVEIFSWWTGGGEEAGLNALIEKFEKDTDYTVENAAVAGGSGTNAQAKLQARLEAQDPPESFQGHAGKELQENIEAGYLEPLTDFYKDEGLNDVLPKELTEQSSTDGEVYSVPVGVHRSNVLWFNPKVLEEAGIEKPPETTEDFIKALKAVKDETDAAPITLGVQWTADHLLENVLLAELGQEGYQALWQEDADWDSPEVTKALEDFEEISGYAETKGGDWQEAAQAVVDGDAAFNVMGDWAAGYFVNDLKKKDGEDFGYVAYPDTDGTYLWLADTFTLPVGAKNSEGTMEWLKLVSSKEGQDLFNPIKGSIPARTDADPEKYDGYLKWALGEWSDAKLAGSYWHGVSATNRQKDSIDNAVGNFLSDKDPDALQKGLVEAAKNP
ncbi:carbohydrate ABC transporter substrate-binding protein (CUT1 family) [Murinocardiopsis flavida]|uniref:Probable sugar-binding periplasmic protein n=1 Tax=Murinocardiopsis flavida TaxID=645275 RepID=A0A2P8DGV5_9ACTN|nr:ABC transporter substrate-binding protein [Murinocardiopsis flavida]PSK96457.1 carbohydrate ABC transporter substrate-binding protein (CUT1 family) [Murinocardiopsis flavida]